MVMFGVFGRKKSSPDIIDELMDVNYEHTKDSNIDELNPSSCTKAARDYLTMELIKSAMDMLHEQIEFLKEELCEKNLIIKELTLRNNNEHPNIIEESRLTPQGNFTSKSSNISKYPNNIVSYSETSSSAPINEEISDATDDLADISSSTVVKDNVLRSSNATYTEGITDNDVTLAPWERYTNGFASKYLERNGYNGGGLGRYGNGIAKPIEVERKSCFDLSKDNEENENKDTQKHIQIPDEPTNVHVWPENTILIAGDSMLHGINEKRLSKDWNVKVRAHSGATIRDMYDHLNALLRKKPRHLILHVGANDAPNREKTADMIFDELIKLKLFAEAKVPNIKVIISCPIVRRDNEVANIKVLHLRHKLRKSGLDIISNERVTYNELGNIYIMNCRKGV